MSPEWIRSGLDLTLIVLVGTGVVQATRLIRHLAGLRASRTEMERFVHDFNATVLRAEAGIRNLKQAARESGDDLEKLVGKSLTVRDELQFIVESADQLAERLSKAVSGVSRPEAKTPEPPAAAPEAKAAPDTQQPASEAQKSGPVPAFTLREQSTSKPSSRAERELLQALQKLN